MKRLKIIGITWTPRWRAGIYRVACAVEYRAGLVVEWSRSVPGTDGLYDWERRVLAGWDEDNA